MVYGLEESKDDFFFFKKKDSKRKPLKMINEISEGGGLQSWERWAIPRGMWCRHRGVCMCLHSQTLCSPMQEFTLPSY